jgi:hypothetical protein
VVEHLLCKCKAPSSNPSPMGVGGVSGEETTLGKEAGNRLAVSLLHGLREVA